MCVCVCKRERERVAPKWLQWQVLAAHVRDVAPSGSLSQLRVKSTWGVECGDRVRVMRESVCVRVFVCVCVCVFVCVRERERVCVCVCV